MTNPPHGIERSPIKYVVFAGNYREFKVWQLENKVQDGEALFVADATNLSSLRGKEVTFVRIGTFHLRKDFYTIMAYAREVWPDAPGFETTS